jgi:hypothetical protein
MTCTKRTTSTTTGSVSNIIGSPHRALPEPQPACELDHDGALSEYPDPFLSWKFRIVLDGGLELLPATR